MKSTQIQLPDELYRRAKQMLLDRYPSAIDGHGTWSMPRVDGGGHKVDLCELRNFAAVEEARDIVGSKG